MGINSEITVLTWFGNYCRIFKKEVELQYSNVKTSQLVYSRNAGIILRHLRQGIYVRFVFSLCPGAIKAFELVHSIQDFDCTIE